MEPLIKTILKNSTKDIFTSEEVISMMPDSSLNAKHSRIKRAIDSGDLVQLKKGLYALGPLLRRQDLSEFHVAKLLDPNSYISLESALSYYSLIPEAVFVICSVTRKRSHTIRNDVGTFTFESLKTGSVGLVQEETRYGDHVIAEPLRALCDLVTLRRKKYTSFEDMCFDLRMDDDSVESGALSLINADVYLKEYGNVYVTALVEVVSER